MDELIKEIKLKIEFNDLPSSLIEKTLSEYLIKNKISIPSNKRDRKIIIKEVRNLLRAYAGRYSMATDKKREKLALAGDIESLLKTHISTKERLSDYPKLKEIIYSLKPHVILDLGCGLNPLAIAKQGMEYYAYDIKQRDLEIVSDWFKKNNILGKVSNVDIRTQTVYPKSDVCLMFKLLDILGEEKREITNLLLSNIVTSMFIISFSTKTLSGKLMNSPYRRWFEDILNKRGLTFTIERTSNELFYIIPNTLKE